MRRSLKIIAFSILLLVYCLNSRAQRQKEIPYLSSKHHSFSSGHLEEFTRPGVIELENYDVLDYSIDLAVNPATEQIQAMTLIQFLPLDDINGQLYFDFAGLQLDSVYLNDLKTSGSLQGEVLTISFDGTLMAGDTQLVCIFYQGKPLKGLYFRRNAYDDVIVYSHNEPYDAHFWFPCKDDPGDKATLTMRVSIPGAMIVLSNGRLIGQSASGPGFTLFVWQETYPIATYLISLSAGPYQMADNTFSLYDQTMPLFYYAYPQDFSRAIQALSVTEEMLVFYSSFIGTYPFLPEKYAMSEVPLREAAAMENQTATTMGDFVMDNEGVIAHELAHQWWGDALTPQTFVDIWLNEGFASYFDALFTKDKYGPEAYKDQMNFFKSRMNTDGSLAYPIYNPPESYLFGNAVYMKGAWVLHMLRFETGESVFMQICQSYFQAHTYENVVTADLIEVTESITGKSYNTFFDQWLNYGGLPVLIGDWSQERDRVTIGIEQFQEEPLYEFTLDILIQGATKDTMIQMPIAEKYTSLNIGFPDIITQVKLDPDQKILNNNNSPLFYIPGDSRLMQIYPNPFHEQVSIVYQIDKSQPVDLRIYDVLGQLVAVLVNEKQNTAVYQVVWNAKNMASGSYYCTLKTDGGYETKKIMLVK